MRGLTDLLTLGLLTPPRHPSSQASDALAPGLRLAGAIAGGLMLGEALALAIGMHLLSGPANPWVTGANEVLLILDIGSGAALVLLAALSDSRAALTMFYVVAGVALLTHGYRDWQYLSGAEDPFCANTVLFVLNNAELAGAVLILLWPVLL